MEDEYDLEGEGPDDKQLVITIKIFPIDHDFPPHISFIYFNPDNSIIE